MLKSGSVIGVLGGGQLGKMIAQAAAELGYQSHVFSPIDDVPATQVTPLKTIAPYEDEAAVRAFAKACDVVTVEFENVPAQTAKWVAEETSLHPNAKTLETAQNRLREKRFFANNDIPVTPFWEVHTVSELETALNEAGGKGILKRVEEGYDGKGQQVISDASNLEQYEDKLKDKYNILEAFIPFAYEISVIVARDAKGNMKAFTPPKNEHKSGILSVSTVPSGADKSVIEQAIANTEKAAKALDIVGLLTVEYFVKEDGSILVNEMAPRPHNSGHWTMDGCITSQFTQIVRAIADMPLANAEMHSPTKMINLIGHDVDDLSEYLNTDNCKIHLYGKSEVRDGRKMGHVNIVSD